MRVQIVVIALLCVVLVLLTACLSKPPPSREPPRYPRAQQLKVQNVTSGMDPVKVFKFWTDDKPEDVFAFYQSALLEDGWQVHDHLSTPSERHFGWGTSDPNEPAYELVIFTTSLGDGRTDVEVDLVTEVPK